MPIPQIEQSVDDPSGLHHKAIPSGLRYRPKKAMKKHRIETSADDPGRKPHVALKSGVRPLPAGRGGRLGFEQVGDRSSGNPKLRRKMYANAPRPGVPVKKVKGAKRARRYM